MQRKRGETIGSWRLIRELGRGGNGNVWLASGESGETVAVKLFREEGLRGARRAERMGRFAREIDILRTISGDPGVLPLLDSCGDLPIPWFAMPVAIPLPKRMAKRPHVEDIVVCVFELAVTLARIASQSGIHHRDIKPENLFWFDGRWVLGDFGLATRVNLEQALTEKGERLGPMYYIAPEMLEDASAAAGGPADVYSLSKCLWKLLTGQHYPVPGEIRLEVSAMRLRSYVAHERVHLLDPLLEAGTRHDPSARPSMGEFAEELGTWLNPLTAESIEGQHEIAPLRKLIEDATAAQQRVYERLNQERTAMNAAVERLEVGVRALERDLRDAGFTSIAVDPNPPEVIFNVAPIRSDLGRFSAPHSSRGFAIGLSAPGGQPPYLYSGIGVQVDADGRQYLVAKHVVTGGRNAREGRVLWVDEGVVLPGSQSALSTEERLAGGLRAHLAEALLAYGRELGAGNETTSGR